MRIEAQLEHQQGDLAVFRDRVGDLRPFFDGIVQDVRELADQTFKAAGPSWPPLSPGWAAQKPGGKSPGVLTGVLRRSFTSQAKYSVAKKGRDAVTVGSRAPHAPLFTRGRGGQPARPVLPTAEDYADRAADALRQHLFGSAGPFDGIIR